jgi:hypothetical protein
MALATPLGSAADDIPAMLAPALDLLVTARMSSARSGAAGRAHDCSAAARA